MKRQPCRDTEHILLCESAKIKKLMGNNVLIPISMNILTELADPSAFWFGPRHMVETDTKYVQMISYIIIKHNNRILCYQRGGDSSEQRLKNKLSIGLGGHISLEDARMRNGTLDVLKTIKAATAREVKEETEIHEVVASKVLALLHSKHRSVDEVHCGFVEMWEVASSQLATKEKTLKIIGFKALSELAIMRGLETWSKLIIQYLSKTNHSIK